MKHLYRNGKLSLAMLLALNFLLVFLAGRFILTAGFYKNNGQLFSIFPDNNNSIYDALQKWVYFSSAVYLLAKLFFITVIIHTALYLSNREVLFSRLFKVVIHAEFIFLIPAAIKLFSFNYTYENGTLLDWQRYYVFSAMSFFNDAPASWYYALQTLNLFEVAYWFLLALGISRITAVNYDDTLVTVLCSYVSALFVWVITVTFFTMLMFPSVG